MTRRRKWILLGPAMALAGTMLVVTFAPRAKAADDVGRSPRTHIVVVCPPAEPCKPRGRAISKVACEMDLRGVAVVVASGTRTRCERVK